jgi:hypothetical protein
MIFEAELIGLKEGIKLCVVWLVFYSYLLSTDRMSLIRPFYAGLAFVFFVSLVSSFIPEGFLLKNHVSNVISMSLAIFFLLSGAVLYHFSGVNLFGKGDFFRRRPVSAVLVFILTLLFFLPDTFGALIYFRELAFLSESVFTTYISAAAGFLIFILVFIAFLKLYKPYRIGSFFDLPQLLLFLAVVKLLGSGIKGVLEISLIPSVQRGFMKFTHDLVHQTFVLLMVPDHPLLKETTWDFIGIFFGPNLASIASLIILLALPALFIHHSLFRPLPEPEGETKVSRRRIRSLILSDRRKKALPVMVFVIFILIAWFSYGGEAVSRIYQPEPRPVVADRGMIVLPLKDPSMDLMDGRLYKFSFIHEGDEIRLIVIRKSDNSLSVCLDACEICPPVGYGQREDHVVCIYCDTPIAIDTLGQPGGCNPIPLEADIDERFITIEVKEILKKWEFVKTEKTGFEESRVQGSE